MRSSLADVVYGFQSFQDALNEFLDHNPRARTYVDNINYHHLCADAARKAKPEYTAIDDIPESVNPAVDRQVVSLDEDNVTESDIECARLLRVSATERLFAEQTLGHARTLEIFPHLSVESPDVAFGPVARTATFEESKTLQDMAKSLESMVNDNLIPLESPPDEGSVNNHLPDAGIDLTEGSAGGETTSLRPLRDCLAVKQRAAHDVVENHLLDTLAGVRREQLLSLVLGPGGTGKTVLINAIVETFEYHNQRLCLQTTATSGVAASLTRGSTIHSWAGLAAGNGDIPAVEDMSDKMRTKRKAHIVPTRYLILDEVSMMRQGDFAKLSDIMSAVKKNSGCADASNIFGGVNIILLGDFHQFPPVRAEKRSLYRQNTDNDWSMRGFQYYRQFQDVFLFDEQMRVKDEKWMTMLTHLRTGDCDAQEVEMVKEQVLGHPNCPSTDWNSPGWANCVLITARNAARIQWNTAAIRRHAYRTGHLIYQFHSEDMKSKAGAGLSMKERLLVAGSVANENDNKRFPDILEVSLGMEAMVTLNLATKSDLANGTRGTIGDIVLDPREPTPFPDSDGVVQLKYPPACIYFKPHTTNDLPSFPGVPKGLLPVVPSVQSFRVNSKHYPSFTVYRRQYALTAGYAFTHHKSQGQTLEYVLVDLNMPGNHTINGFNVYVALSRSRGRHTIRLLRDFDAKIMTQPPPLDLMEENKRLAEAQRDTFKRYKIVI